MKIAIYSISKDNKEIDIITKDYIKMSSKFSKIDDFNIFSKSLNSLTNLDEIKLTYSDLFYKYMKNSYNIALSIDGAVQMDSHKFASFISKIDININFFIAGAFGFEQNFLSKCDKIISLSQMTFGHKLAKLMLCEQIYRALTIINNHPYHK
jgi:23S rRNA (pseudouridine1915-N3)-methyltransferase